jgi:hypothetical protein
MAPALQGEHAATFPQLEESHKVMAGEREREREEEPFLGLDTKGPTPCRCGLSARTEWI